MHFLTQPDANPIASISRPMSSQSRRSVVSDAFDPEQPPEEEMYRTRIPEEDEKKKKFSFPWWFSIIAWILLILSVAVSVCFVTFYGIMFGDAKSKKWLTSMLVAFFASVFFTQPIQVGKIHFKARLLLFYVSRTSQHYFTRFEIKLKSNFSSRR